MIQKPHVPKQAMRLDSPLTFRMKLLVAAIVGGGTMIAFPAASAAVVAYVAVALATMGLLAWTGLVALVPVAAAAIGALIVMVVAVLVAVTGVRCLIWIVPFGGDAEDLHSQQVSAVGTVPDGVPAAPARRRVARRRVRRFGRHRAVARADAGPSEEIGVLA